MRLFLAAIAAALLLVACGGDDDTADPTGAATGTPDPAVSPGQQTPNPDACLREDLEAEVVSMESEAGATVIILEVTNTERACVLGGPPEVRWYDAQGIGTGVPYTPAADCDEGETEYEDCVYPDQIELPDPGLDIRLPPGTPQSVRAIISVTDVDALIPCASPAKQAETLGLQFPGVSLDVQAELKDPVDLQLCSAQVILVGYGPVLEG